MNLDHQLEILNTFQYELIGLIRNHNYSSMLESLEKILCDQLWNDINVGVLTTRRQKR